MNYEVRRIFEKIISDWFINRHVKGEEFIDALLTGDLDSMNAYMSEIVERTFSFFAAGGKEPERFYHAFVLGLIVGLRGRYEIVSSRGSGPGRCDAVMLPLRQGERGIVIEFRTRLPRRERSLADTCASALRQIADKRHALTLAARGAARSAIYAYGVAFNGREVLIRGGAVQEDGHAAGQGAGPGASAGQPAEDGVQAGPPA